MMSGRGRGPRHGAVSIRVERVIRNQDNQENGSVYEDEVVYVTEGPRRRGRPRKPASVTPRPQPKPLPHRYPQSNEVIYVSAARGRPQYVSPCVVHQPPHRTTNLVQGSRPLSVCAAASPRPVRCIVTGIPPTGQTIVNIPKPVLTLGVQRTSAETKIDWPEDLQDLVNNWDNLPERRTRDMVKWFQTVSQLPRTICEIQEMWSDMDESWEEKAALALEWLREPQPQPQPTPTPPPVSRAKVLVEAQPNHIQDCGQLSSMTENRDNRIH